MKSPLFHLIVASVICAVAVIGYGVWYAAIETKSAAVASLESQIATKTEAASRIASARASLAEISGDETTLQGYFVPESGVVSFINTLEELGKAQGAAVSVLSVSTSGTKARPTLTLALTTKGTFDAVMRTVGAIEYAPYDLSFSTLALGQDTANNWHAAVNLVVGSVSVGTATSTP
ncbi:MAG: hypothetical protein B7W98_00195 [Parcubacteria group bacterium 20-58-5]|nr:MAG: hypothetical protein B7W98_00195 [Parcubacteria group bacterium 20-58-5]OYV62891.1 MAG: hypothetical protein B7X03_03880 [Parcubacteria group bacterium 21-58-10]HQT82790.1 hypothetical protein [Candidatus Paceibacterota bacterium]